MPWQLEEDLARAFFAKNPDKVARIGLSAISLEYTTKHDDRAEEYAAVWDRAAAMLKMRALQPEPFLDDYRIPPHL
ncbi:hypothetical protein IPO96_04910 [Candidatus Saccharibacteria bacterium]|jgi:hypothetical protein|nr:MAG: hypothetical protein IPO96_04910 [Candidatus Saccharibacteria bacterium]